MPATCPAGHRSESDDYCDVCGMPIVAAPATSPTTPPPPTDAPTQAPAGQLCPNCSTQNVADALFCEQCGYDFTTATLPRSAGPTSGAPAEPDTTGAPPPEQAAPESRPPAPELTSRWVAEVWIDPAWYEAQESPDALPSPGLPTVVALGKKSVLVGRKSRSRNIDPDIDCESDTGTSRRQAQLTTDGQRWWVEDLGSANGTFVGAASEPLPDDPIPVGVKRELDPDDRIYVGAWTRLVIREATDEELAGG